MPDHPGPLHVRTPISRKTHLWKAVEVDWVETRFGQKKSSLYEARSRSRNHRGRKGPGGSAFKPELIFPGANMGYDVTALF
jgi:hypothetical protein